MTDMRRPRPHGRGVSLGIALLLACLAGSAAAQRNIGVQPRAGEVAAESVYGESWAVVIGINDYRHTRIDKPSYAVTALESRSEGRCTIIEWVDSLLTISSAI